MKPTIPENKVIRPERIPESKTPTKELEFEDEEITAVEPFVEHHAKFILNSEDVEMVREISANQEISYDAALHIVLRDALELYRWNHKRPVR